MCDDCGPTAATGNENGRRVCMECGMELGQVIASDAEWRTTEGELYGSKLKRVGAQYDRRLPISCMRTCIRQRKTARGESRAMGFGLMRQHCWTSGATPYHERTQRGIFGRIEQVCCALGLTRTIQRRAECLFESVNDELRTRADGRVGIIAAAVLRAAKEAGVPRSLKELARVFETSPANITKGANLLHMTIFLLDGGGARTRSLHVSRAVDYVPRFCSDLGLGRDVCAVAVAVARRTEEKRITSDNEPPSVAGGAILLVVELTQKPARVSKAQKEAIAASAQVSVVTIVKVRKRLHRYRAALFTPADGETLRRIRKNKGAVEVTTIAHGRAQK